MIFRSFWIAKWEFGFNRDYDYSLSLNKRETPVKRMPQSPMVFVQCSRLLRSFCVIIELCTVRNSHSLNLFWKEIQSIHENVTMPNPHLYFQLSRISFSESRYRKRFFILRRGSFEYGEEIREKMVNTSLALHFPSIRCVVPLTKWSNERTKKKNGRKPVQWLLTFDNPI